MKLTRIAASATSSAAASTAALRLCATLGLMGLSAGAAIAADPAKGEADFKKCKACHAVIADDGTEIQKGGKTGPNLFGVIGRPVASVEGFKYGESLKEAGAKGLVWDEAMLASYIGDPKAWLKEQLGTDAVKTSMSFRLNKGNEDMAAYLHSLKP